MRIPLLLVFSAFAWCFSCAEAQADVTVKASAGTLGVGGEVGYRLKRPFGVRGGWGFFDYGYNFDAEDSNGVQGDELNYRGDFELNNGHLLADWYPTNKSFRVSAGIVLNLSEVNNTASCNNSSGFCETGDGDSQGGGLLPGQFQNGAYSREFLGEIDTKIDFQPIAPYVGVGWGARVTSGWRFEADLGIAYMGNADAELSSNGECNQNAECRASLEQEEKELEEEFSRFQFYPVANIGISYHF